MMFSQKLNIHRIFKRLAKALIRLRVCAGWSEPLLVAHTTLLEISCRGSIIYFTTAGDRDCVAAEERPPALHHSLYLILLSALNHGLYCGT